MSIRATITGDFTAIDLTRLTDDMLAEVVSKHAEERFRPANRANAVAAGDYVSYTVSVDGQVVGGGKGEMFPTTPTRALVSARGRAVRVINVDWMWDRLSDSALAKAIEAYQRAESTLARTQTFADFVSLVLNARNDSVALFQFLLKQYAKHRYPQAMRALSEARALWKVYRRISLGKRLLIGKGRDAAGGDADPEVLAWIASELIARSPVVSGAYRDAHALYADGEFLMSADEVSEDSEIVEADEYSFTNTVPYSRKIEFGKTKAGRDFVIQVHPHIYERVAEEARGRFGNVADILYEVRGILGGEQLRQPKTASSRPVRAASGVRESRLGRQHGQYAHNASDVRYPSIVVRFR